MMLMKFYENKKNEKKKKLKIKTTKKILMAAAAGSLGGLVGGVLFSPKSGKETRKHIGNVSKNIKHKTEELKDNIDSKVTDVKDGVAEAKIKITEYLNEKKTSKITTDSEDLCSAAVQANVIEPEIKEKEITK